MSSNVPTFYVLRLNEKRDYNDYMGKKPKAIPRSARKHECSSRLDHPCSICII